MNGYVVTYRIGAAAPAVRAVRDDPTLTELQEAVDGWIESVPFFNTVLIDGQVIACVAYGNEEGKLANLPVNLAATQAWHRALQRIVNSDGERAFPNGLCGADGAPVDLLVGPIIVVAGDAAFLHRHKSGVEADDDQHPEG
jgi:hypothetical protein